MLGDQAVRSLSAMQVRCVFLGLSNRCTQARRLGRREFIWPFCPMTPRRAAVVAFGTSCSEVEILHCRKCVRILQPLFGESNVFVRQEG